MSWITDYGKMTKDERDCYKEHIYDDKQRIDAVDYDRLVESLKYIATDPEELIKHTSIHLNLANDVALSFEYEAFYLYKYFYNKQLADIECMQKFEKMDDLFNKICQDEKNDWSLDYMINDEKWISIRTISNDILSKLGASITY